MTSLLLAGGTTIISLVGLWFFCHKWLKPRIQGRPIARQILVGIEVLFAVSITIFSNVWDLFKKSSWLAEDVWPLKGAAFVGFLVGAYVIAKVLGQWHKDEDGETLRSLKAKNESLEQQRNVLRRVLTMTDQILEKKMVRIREAQKNEAIKDQPAQLMADLDPKRQILVILTSLHAFWKRLLDDGKRLRMGVYVPVDGHLKPIFSFYSMH